MPSLNDVDPSILFAMFKGEPGTRKSTAALSFPGPQFWFSWDRKMNGILIPAKKWGLDLKTIDYEDYDSWNSGAKNPVQKLESFQVKCPYKTLIFDSITSAADMTLRQTLKEKAGNIRKSGKSAGNSVAGIAINEIEDYNAESAALQELIALAKDIHTYHGVNIILIAHVVQAEYRNSTNNTTHVSRTIVTAGKRVAPKIPAYCGEVYHFNIKPGLKPGDGAYTILTEHTGDDFARTSLGLPSEIVFNDKPLYSEFILPAIEATKKMPVQKLGG